MSLPKNTDVSFFKPCTLPPSLYWVQLEISTILLAPFQSVMPITSRSFHTVCPTRTLFQSIFLTSLCTLAHVGAFLKCPNVTPENSVLQSRILDSGRIQLSNSSCPSSETMDILAICYPSTHYTNSQSRARYEEEVFLVGDFELGVGVDCSRRNCFQFWLAVGVGLGGRGVGVVEVGGSGEGVGALGWKEDWAWGLLRSYPRRLLFRFLYYSIGMLYYQSGFEAVFEEVFGQFSSGNSVSNYEIFFCFNNQGLSLDFFRAYPNFLEGIWKLVNIIIYTEILHQNSINPLSSTFIINNCLSLIYIFLLLT